jgi:hypothetical protein
MRRMLFSVAAAAALLTAAPAMAQVGFDFHIGPDRGWRSHDEGWRTHDEGWRSYGSDRGHHYGWSGDRDRDRGCKSVTVRETLPNGRTIVRTRERC